MADTFSIRQGRLWCEGVSLERLAEEFGTPLYVYSLNHILARYRAYDEALSGTDHLVCCAVKANSNVAILKALAAAGAGFDLVSGGELYRVAQAGGDPRRCVFAGVGKTREEIEYALRLGVYSFNVESEPELELISAVAARRGTRAPIALRVNPGVDPHTHHYISTGKQESKFGIGVDDALRVYRRAARMPGIAIRGVQMHIGSQITALTPYRQAMRKIVPLVEAVRELAPATFAFVDVGGGLGISYREENPPAPEALAGVARAVFGGKGLRLLVEPGRSIVGNAGVLVTRVTYVKRTSSKRFVIVDAAMNDLIRPALYGSYHEIRPVRPARTRGSAVVDVVGPVCESGDFLATGRRLQLVRSGELLAVMSAGAYGMAMASNYNTRPRPAEVLVNGRRYGLIRRRETVKDLLGVETIPAWA